MKFKRTERIGAIVKILSDNPNRTYTLGYFTDKFNAAKSTISEDLLVVKNVFEKLQLGKVITISGAAGGVKYIPKTSVEENNQVLMELCNKIDDQSRILSGGFLYLVDLIYDPTIAAKVGKIFASNIDYEEANYVVTMETKGIPMASMTAKAMNLPLVIIRKDTKVSEGPTLSTTYVSGNSSQVESMSLPRRALKPNSKVIIIDDFMRGGGTIRGMIDLMNEFGAEVIGTGVFISKATPKNKLVDDYISLIQLNVEDDVITVEPNLKTFKDEYKADENGKFNSQEIDDSEEIVEIVEIVENQPENSIENGDFEE
jgi:purine operon repressor